MIDVFGTPDRVSLKLTLLKTYGDIKDSNPGALLTYILGKLNEKKLGFAHVSELPEEKIADLDSGIKGTLRGNFKKLFNGTWIANAGFGFESGN